MLLAVGLLFLRRRHLVRRGDGGDPRARRGGALRAARVQRPGRLPDRLGALPRLPDRDRARRALRAALPRRHALGVDALTDSPWDTVVGVALILAIAGIRLVRRPGLYRLAIWIAGFALAAQLLLIVARRRLPAARATGSARACAGARRRPGARSRSRVPLAMLAYTGLETVANLAAETRSPGKTLPRSLVRRHRRGRRRLGRDRGRRHLGVPAGARARTARTAGRPTLGIEWIRAPLVGITEALDASLPGGRRRRPARARRTDRRLRARRGGDDVDLRRRPPRLLARAARHAAARLRAPEPADADGAGGDRLDRRRRRRLPGRRGVRGRPGAVPRRALLVRRPARVHRRSGRGRAASLHGARARATVPGAVRGALAGDAACRCSRWSAPRSRSPSGCSRSSRTRPRASSGPLWLLAGVAVFVLVRARAPRAGARPRRSRRGRHRPVRRRRLPPHSRAAQARPDRRRGARDGAPARRGARARAVCVFHGVRCRWSWRSTPSCPRRRSSHSPRSWTRASSPRSTASRSRPSSVRTRALGEAIVEQAREWQADLIVHGLGAALAAAVAFLQPDGRPRAAQGALRGDGDRLSAGRPRGDLRSPRTPLRSSA